MVYSLDELFEKSLLGEIKGLDSKGMIILQKEPSEENKKNYSQHLNAIIVESGNDNTYFETFGYIIGMMKKQGVSFYNDPMLYQECTFSAICHHVIDSLSEGNVKQGKKFVEKYYKTLSKYGISSALNINWSNELLKEISQFENSLDSLKLIIKEKYIDKEILMKYLGFD